MVCLFEQNKLLTAEEVAPILGVKPSTLSKWVYENRIPYVKFGPGKKSIVMFNPKRLNLWIEENSHEPGLKIGEKYKLGKSLKAHRPNIKCLDEFNAFVARLN